MGQQGNYPGSGARTRHHNQATGKSVAGSHVGDVHLKEGESYTDSAGGSAHVKDVKMPKGSGSAGKSVRGKNHV